MQTFLPYPCFTLSAAVLDSKRLGKQRVEALQVLRALAGLSRGWRRHPAVLMWAGHEASLRRYYAAVVAEWVRRGYRNTMPLSLGDEAGPDPAWLGDAKLHLSHQSSLVRKLPSYYRPLFGDVPDVPYVWPVRAIVRPETI